MVNRWTGAYDAVIEFSPGGAELLLAALHRKGHARADEPTAGPHLLHSTSLNLPLDGPIAGRNLRGHLEVQVSTPSIAVPFGPDFTRVTVSMEFYSWFQAAFGSDPAPEFLHGTLALTLSVRVWSCEGVTMAEIDTGDVQASFVPAPGSGASPADVALVEAAVPSILRDGLDPMQVSLGTFNAGSFTVRDLGFRTVREGFRSGLALLLGLREPSGPAPSPAGVNEVFLGEGQIFGSEQAAFALGREFLTSVLFEMAQDPLAGISVSGSSLGLSFAATVDPASLLLELREGSLRSSVEGSGSASVVGPFRFRVIQDFGLRIEQGRLALTLAAAPEIQFISGGVPGAILGVFEGLIANRIQNASEAVIPVANSELNKVLDESVAGLMSQLDIPGAQLILTRASIDLDAVIIGARVDIGPPPLPVVSFRRVDRPSKPATALHSIFSVELEFNALESWIPGGTIEQYRWQEIRSDGTVARQLIEPHTFIGRIVPELLIDAGFAAAGGSSLPVFSGSSFDSSTIGWPPTTWCLEIQGTQVLSGEGPPATVVHRACATSVIVASLDVSRSERLTVRVPDGRGGALADIDPWGQYRPHALAADTENRGYLLVHRPGPDLDESVAALRKALSRNGRGPLVLAVLIAEELACGCPPAVRETANLAITHDPEKRWRERFGLQEPGTVLVGPGGRETWRGRGPLQADELLKVLAGLQNRAPRPPRRTQLSLALGLGQLAPDLFFPCGPDERIAMRKMRGRDIVLCFWTTWSDPSLEEIRRLSASPPGRRYGGPLLLCVNDGEDPALAARVLGQIEPNLKLVPDPQRVLSRRYGVTCWPTVVRVDPRGRIAQVRFGLEPAAEECAGGKQAYAE